MALAERTGRRLVDNIDLLKEAFRQEGTDTAMDSVNVLDDGFHYVPPILPRYMTVSRAVRKYEKGPKEVL